MNDTTPPNQIFTRSELALHNGEDRDTRLVAYQGIVYDVTNCPKWQQYLHENLHFPGQDLTTVLPDAPHSAEVFNYPCVKPIGTLRT